MKLRALPVLVLLMCMPVSAQPFLDVEKEVLDGTNQMRARDQITPLTLDHLLSKIARGHSEEMLSKGYFSHDSPNALCKRRSRPT